MKHKAPRAAYWAALAAAGMAALGALALSGCAAKDSGIVFRIALDADINSLDPGLAIEYESVQVVRQLTEGVLGFDGSGGVVPVLASKWRQADDLTYVYEMRPNVTFSDGTPMTMDDVFFSLERARKGEDNNDFAICMEAVDHFSIDGWTLTAHLKHPSAIFKYALATYAGIVISKAYYLAHRENFGTPEGGILATGPFVCKSWIPDESITLERNERYWDKEALAANHVKEIVFMVLSDSSIRLAALQAESVDFTMFIALERLNVLADNPRFKVSATDSMGVIFLALNTGRPPFNDKNVRKALSHAIDIYKMNDEIGAWAGPPGTTLLFGPSLYGGDAARWEAYLAAVEGYDYNLRRAKAYLDQSAYPDGFECTLVVDAWLPINMARAQFIRNSLAYLGITVKIIPVNVDDSYPYLMGKVLDKNGARDYDLIISDTAAVYPDLTNIVENLLVSSASFNTAAYQNAEMDTLVTAQTNEPDPEKRFELQRRMADLARDDVPYIPLEYMMIQSALNTKYTGLLFTPDWLSYFPVQNIRRAE
ncbi:MAG: ABC transporter substrate-binding protein [Treponema sp.]|jgi:peptide/nickel transport system substrate-binding protein|nr:ABC transporter substrate-binding protein [Treponema sp.]